MVQCEMAKWGSRRGDHGRRSIVSTGGGQRSTVSKGDARETGLGGMDGRGTKIGRVEGGPSRDRGADEDGDGWTDRQRTGSI